MVTFHFIEGTARMIPMTMTASHMIMARQQGKRQYRRVLASELQSGDLMRIHGSRDSVAVARTQHAVLSEEVVEVRLVDTKGSFFAGMPGSSPSTFVEVCGAMAPLGGSMVEVLHFQRFDRFRDIFLRNAELDACREDLCEAGYDVDLGLQGLGSGKLLVRKCLAERTIRALRLREAKLKASDVV